MTTMPLTVYVDAEAAKAFAEASAEDQRKMQHLLSLRLKELVAPARVPLREVMDRIGQHAEARGLTAEILESLLHDG